MEMRDKCLPLFFTVNVTIFNFYKLAKRGKMRPGIVTVLPKMIQKQQNCTFCGVIQVRVLNCNSQNYR